MSRLGSAKRRAKASALSGGLPLQVLVTMTRVAPRRLARASGRKGVELGEHRRKTQAADLSRDALRQILTAAHVRSVQHIKRGPAAAWGAGLATVAAGWLGCGNRPFLQRASTSTMQIFGLDGQRLHVRKRVVRVLRAGLEALIDHRQHQARFDQRKLKADAAAHADAERVIGIGVAGGDGIRQETVGIEALGIACPSSAAGDAAR